MSMIKAEISGSNRARALGIEVVWPSPVLALCRKLIAAGYDPSEPLEAYRGDVLCLRVRTIGEGAKLTVDESRGIAFAKYKPTFPEQMAQCTPTSISRVAQNAQA